MGISPLTKMAFLQMIQIEASPASVLYQTLRIIGPAVVDVVSTLILTNK